MASIYKRTQDKDKRRACWYFNYLDHKGKRNTRRGFTDKKKTEQLAAAVELKERQRTLELLDPEQERLVAEKKRPILEHVEDYEASLAKRTEKYRKQLINRLKLVITQAKIETMADATIAVVEKAIADICEEHDFGHQTYNHYVDSCFAFCKWMARKAKRIPANPLEGIEKLNVQEDIRHPRRALTAAEFALLVCSARASGVLIQCYDGETRARIYIISYLTGLRRSEIASLTPESFVLTGDQPTVTVQAAHSKHRRKDVLPLHNELVAMLNDWLTEVKPGEPLFPKLAKRRTWKMVKLDLKRAGIPYQTPEGIADFHAAGRHTHITELLRNGASLVEARELARHSDIKMTMKYTHIGVQEQAKAVQNIPTSGLRKKGDHNEDQNAPFPQPQKSWEYPGSKPGVTNEQTVSSIDNMQSSHQTTKPLSETEVIAKKHQLSSVVKSGGGGNRTRVP